MVLTRSQARRLGISPESKEEKKYSTSRARRPKYSTEKKKKKKSTKKQTSSRKGKRETKQQGGGEVKRDAKGRKLKPQLFAHYLSREAYPHDPAYLATHWIQDDSPSMAKKLRERRSGSFHAADTPVGVETPGNNGNWQVVRLRKNGTHYWYDTGDPVIIGSARYKRFQKWAND